MDSNEGESEGEREGIDMEYFSVRRGECNYSKEYGSAKGSENGGRRE
jgi:hypothetical protein